jgi:phenylacetic acid degradation operon negative regulatory protein
MTDKNKALTIKILKGLGIGVLFTAVSILNPQFPYVALKAYLKTRSSKKYTDKQLYDTIKYLKRKKFIAYSNGKFIITKVGHKHLEAALTQKLTIEKVKWDKKWRFVSFDIPEEQKNARFVFRRRLAELGFYNFQRSLFVIPYPCQKTISTLIKTLKIEPHVHVFTAERFPNDSRLARFYSLGI